MAVNKFYSESGATDSPEVASDYEQAQQFDKLRVGRLGVYFREGLKMKYLPYSGMDKVFLRINEVNGKLCCGSTVFQYFKLVFCKDGKELTDCISENEKSMRDALDCIAKTAPQLRIGVNA